MNALVIPPNRAGEVGDTVHAADLSFPASTHFARVHGEINMPPARAAWEPGGRGFGFGQLFSTGKMAADCLTLREIPL